MSAPGLRPARVDELPRFAAMEQHPDARHFVQGYDLERHHREFADPAIRYLAIVDAADDLLGFVLLRRESATVVEFRRIVVARTGGGTGGVVVAMLPAWCRTHYGAQRMWLDVFSENERARSLYRRLGWRDERSMPQADGRVLVVMTLDLASPR